MSTDALLIPAPAQLANFRPMRSIQTVEAAYDYFVTQVAFVKNVLHRGVDYGIIPGTERKDKDGRETGTQVLLLPGAEKLTSFYSLSIELPLLDQALDWTGNDHNAEPFFYFRYGCRVTWPDGTVCQLDASANSWEEKWRYRYVPKLQVPEAYLDRLDKLPSKGGRVSEFDFAIEKSETTGQYGKPAEYWSAFKQAIVDGTAVEVQRKTRAGKEMKAWEMDTTVYAIPNTRIYDQVNTVGSIARKRAFVACVNYAVGASQFFTVDMERLYQDEEGKTDGDKEEGSGEQTAASGVAVTVAEGKQRLILELTRGVNGAPIYYADQYAIAEALKELKLAYTSLEDHQPIKEALIKYALR